LSAILLTLLFALFPPNPAELAKTPPVATPNSATYQSRASSSVTTPPHPPPTVTAANDTLKSKPRGAVAPTVTPSATPQTATLTMVTAGPAKSPNESGLAAALLGPLYHDAVTIDGFTIPLPPGAWTSLAHSTITEQSATGDVHFLGQIRDKRLIGAIRIFVAHSKDRPGAGFNEVKSCTEVNPGRTLVAIDESPRMSCLPLAKRIGHRQTLAATQTKSLTSTS
jgi:hypothetical protein